MPNVRILFTVNKQNIEKSRHCESSRTHDATSVSYLFYFSPATQGDQARRRRNAKPWAAAAASQNHTAIPSATSH